MDTHSAKVIAWFILQDEPVSPSELLSSHVAWTDEEPSLTRQEIRDAMCKLIDEGILVVNWDRKMTLNEDH